MADNKEIMSGSGSDSFIASIQEAEAAIAKLDKQIVEAQANLKQYSGSFGTLSKNAEKYVKFNGLVEKTAGSLEKTARNSLSASKSISEYKKQVEELNRSLNDYIKLSAQAGENGKFAKPKLNVPRSRKPARQATKPEVIYKNLEQIFGAITRNKSGYLKTGARLAKFSTKDVKKLATVTKSMSSLIGVVGAGAGVVTALAVAFKMAFDAGQAAYEKNLKVNKSLRQMGASADEFNRSGVKTANQLIDIGNKWKLMGEDLTEIFEPLFTATIALVDGLTDLLKDLTGSIRDAFETPEKKRERETQYTPANSRAKWYTRQLEEQSGIPESTSLPVIGDISSSAKQSGFTNPSAANLAIGTYDAAVKLAKEYGEKSEDIAKKLADAWLSGSEAAKEYGVVVDDQVLAGYMATKGVDIVNVEITDAMRQYYRYQLMLEQTAESNSDAMQEQVKQWKQLGMQIDKAKGKLFSFDEVINLDAFDPTIPDVGIPNVSFPETDRDSGEDLPPIIGGELPTPEGPNTPNPPGQGGSGGAAIDIKWNVEPFVLSDYLPQSGTIGIDWAVAALDLIGIVPKVMKVGIEWIVEQLPLEGVVPETVEVGLKLATDMAFQPLMMAYDAIKYMADLAEAGGINLPIEIPELYTIGDLVGWVGQLIEDIPLLNETFSLFNGTIQNTMIPTLEFNTELEKTDSLLLGINEKIIEQTGVVQTNTEAVQGLSGSFSELNTNIQQNIMTQTLDSISSKSLERQFEETKETVDELSDKYDDNRSALDNLNNSQNTAKSTAGSLKGELEGLGNSANSQVSKLDRLRNAIDQAMNKWNEARKIGMLTGNIRQAQEMPTLPTLDMSTLLKPQQLKQQQKFDGSSMLDLFGINQTKLKQQYMDTVGGEAGAAKIRGQADTALGLAGLAGIGASAYRNNQLNQMMQNPYSINMGGYSVEGVGNNSSAITGPITGQPLGVSSGTSVSSGVDQTYDAIWGNFIDRLNEFRALNYQYVGRGFADGGIGTKEIKGASLFEDNKKEAVIPLESQQGIDFLANAMRQAGSGSEGGGSNIEINLTLDGIFDTDDQGKWTRLAEKLAEEIDLLLQRRGSLGYGASY